MDRGFKLNFLTLRGGDLTYRVTFLITIWLSKIVKRFLWPFRLERSFQIKILCSTFFLVLAKFEQFGWKPQRHIREIWSSPDLTLSLTSNSEKMLKRPTIDNVMTLRASWFCSNSDVQLNMRRKSGARLDRYHRVIPRIFYKKWAPIFLKGYRTHNTYLFNRHLIILIAKWTLIKHNK